MLQSPAPPSSDTSLTSNLELVDMIVSSLGDGSGEGGVEVLSAVINQQLHAQQVAVTAANSLRHKRRLLRQTTAAEVAVAVAVAAPVPAPDGGSGRLLKLRKSSKQKLLSVAPRTPATSSVFSLPPPLVAAPCATTTTTTDTDTTTTTTAATTTTTTADFYLDLVKGNRLLSPYKLIIGDTSSSSSSTLLPTQYENLYHDQQGEEDSFKVMTSSANTASNSSQELDHKPPVPIFTSNPASTTTTTTPVSSNTNITTASPPPPPQLLEPNPPTSPPQSQQQQDSLTRSMADIQQELDNTIKVKAEISLQLAKSHKELERTRHSHLEKVARLERDLGELDREVVKLRADLESSESTKEKQRDEYEKRLKHTSTQLNTTRLKLTAVSKEADAAQTATRKLADATGECERLVGVVAGLRKRVKEEVEKAGNADARRQKEIAALRREKEDVERTLRRTNEELETLRKRLDKRSDEVASLKHRVGGSAAAVAASSSSSSVVSLPSLLKKSKDVSAASSSASINNNNNHNQISASLHAVAAVPQQPPTSSSSHQHTPRRSSNLHRMPRDNTAILTTHHDHNSTSGSGSVGAMGVIPAAAVADLKSLVADVSGHPDLVSTLSSLLESKHDESALDSVFRSIGILARLVANERTRHYSDLQKKIAKLRSGTTPASSSGGGNSSTIGLPLAFTKRSGKSTQTDAVLPSITQQRQEQQQQSMDNNSNHSTEATASEASAKIAALSKDLVYYKSTNKELKRKMRQLVAMNNQLAQVAHGVGTRHESGGGVGGGGKEEESAGAGALRTSVGVY